MTTSRGISKKIAYKKESSGWGVLASGSGAKYLRRVTGGFNLTKDTYTSAEINPSFQIADMRHGIRSVDGSLSGELSPSSYSDFMQSVIAKDFVTGGSATGLSVTIATSGSLFTITRSTGSWITDGFYVGNVIRMTGAGLNVANQSNNALVVAMSATVLTVQATSSTALVAEGPIASVAVAVPGKLTYTPLTGHTDDSYTVEEFYSDIAQSEVFSGVKVGSMAVSLPTTGLVTCDFNFMGKDLAQTGTSQYFTTPTTASTTGIFASVSGTLVVNGAPIGLITSMDFTVERGLEAANVVGSNVSANVFTGKFNVSGNFSTYFQDGTYRDYFKDETAISVIVALSTGTEKNAEVISFAMPRVKIGSATKNDGEMGIVQDHSFVALVNSVTTAGLAPTTLLVQDTTVA